MPRYPVILERDTNGTIRVEFPDVPEANTFGEDADEALMQAVDALESALSLYIEDRRDIPKPSPVKPRGKAVALPALTEAKLALYSAMRQSHWKSGAGAPPELASPPGGPLARPAPRLPARSARSRIPCARQTPGRRDPGSGVAGSRPSRSPIATTESCVADGGLRPKRRYGVG